MSLAGSSGHRRPDAEILSNEQSHRVTSRILHKQCRAIFKTRANEPSSLVAVYGLSLLSGHAQSFVVGLRHQPGLACQSPPVHP